MAVPARSVAFRPLACAVALAVAACTEISSGSPTTIVEPPAAGPAAFDPDIGPRDDFYRWVNGPWMRGMVLPAELGSYGAFVQRAEEVEGRMLDIIFAIAREEGHPEGSLEAHISELFHLYLDRAAVQIRGLDFLISDYPHLWRVEGDNPLARLIGRRLLYGLSAPIALEIHPDAGGSGRNVLYLGQSGLGLPDREYYLSPAQSPARADLVAAYEAYAREVFRLLGLESADARARGVLALERALAAAHWDSVEARDRTLTYNRFDAAGLGQLAPGLRLNVVLDGLWPHAGDSVVVSQPSYLRALDEMAERFPAAQWSDYFLFRLVDDLHDVLPDAIAAARHEVYGRRLRGQAARARAEDMIVSFFNRLMAPELGGLYAARHFAAADGAAVEAIAVHIKAGFHKRLEANRWMSGTTRAAALEKLDRMEFRIGHAPHPVRRPIFPRGVPPTLAEAALAAGRARTEQELMRLGLDAARAPAPLLPQKVGAYYEAYVNVVNIPAGVIAPPFYDADRDAALNYGAIGGIIGHEITHGFDDQGRKSDASGRLHDWWTAADAAEFARISERLVEQYSDLEPAPGLRVDGRRTLSENIGDLGGLFMALEGLRLEHAERGLSAEEARESERRFFTGWGRIWRRVYTREELRRRLLVDPHAPAEYRVNMVLRNLDGFHRAYEVGPGDAMWLEPADRVEIW